MPRSAGMFSMWSTTTGISVATSRNVAGDLGQQAPVAPHLHHQPSSRITGRNASNTSRPTPRT